MSYLRASIYLAPRQGTFRQRQREPQFTSIRWCDGSLYPLFPTSSHAKGPSQGCLLPSFVSAKGATLHLLPGCQSDADPEGLEEPERRRQPETKNDREEDTSSKGESEARKTPGAHQDYLGDECPVNHRSEERVNVGPRVVCAETEQEYAVVGDRDRKYDSCAARPAVHDVVETSLWREPEQLVDARRGQELGQPQRERDGRQPDLHVQCVAKEQVEERSGVGRLDRLLCDQSHRQTDDC